MHVCQTALNPLLTLGTGVVPRIFTMNFFLVTVSIFIVILPFITATDFEPCEKGSQPLAVDVHSCLSQPCQFKRGSNTTVSVDFTVDHDVEDMAANITINMLVPSETSVRHACNHVINGECPLDAGEQVTYVANVPFQESLPKVRATINFSLTDENDEVITCFLLSGYVVE